MWVFTTDSVESVQRLLAECNARRAARIVVIRIDPTIIAFAAGRLVRDTEWIVTRTNGRVYVTVQGELVEGDATEVRGGNDLA